MNSKETNEEAAPKTGLNHLFTDETTDEAVISVDATATEVSSYATGASFQDYVYWKQWRDEMDGLGFLNISVGVNRVHVGVDLLSPTKTSYRGTLITST